MLQPGCILPPVACDVLWLMRASAVLMKNCIRQLANGVRGAMLSVILLARSNASSLNQAHISMRIVNADNAKEAAALIAQLHTRLAAIDKVIV